MQSPSKKFAADSLKLTGLDSRVLGARNRRQRSRQQADFLAITEHISAFPPFITSQIALNRQQPRLMVNGVMVQAPAKLSVALVTSFRDLRMRRSWPDLEDIQVGQYLEQARDRKPRTVLLISVHICLGMCRIEQAPFSTIKFHGPGARSSSQPFRKFPSTRHDGEHQEGAFDANVEAIS